MQGVKLKAGVFGLILVGTTLGYQQLNQAWQARQDKVRWLDGETACQLGQQVCQASDSSGVIRVSTPARRMITDSPFELIVELEQFDARQLSLQLEGVDMFMGVSRYRLLEQDDGRYGLSLRLPACSEQQMRWRASVIAETALGQVGYRFEFDASRS